MYDKSKNGQLNTLQRDISVFYLCITFHFLHKNVFILTSSRIFPVGFLREVFIIFFRICKKLQFVNNFLL